MRFTAHQYDQAIEALTLAKQQLEADGNSCSICTDSGHMAFECGHNPLLAVHMCRQIADESEHLHETLHQLAGCRQAFGVQLGPARCVMPERSEGIEAFLMRLEATLDPQTRNEFGVVAERLLRKSMERCGMKGYPDVCGNPDGERVSGAMVCETCGQDYYSHPLDWRLIGYGNVPFLNVLCDGRRVKL